MLNFLCRSEGLLLIYVSFACPEPLVDILFWTPAQVLKEEERKELEANSKELLTFVNLCHRITGLEPDVHIGISRSR